MAYTKVELQTWKPVNPKDAIEGIYLGHDENVGANDSMLYHIEVDKQPWGVWGSTVLDGKMTTAKSGDKIKIEYLGKGDAKPGKNAPKLFEVYIDYELRADPETQRLMAQANQNLAADPSGQTVVPAQAPAQPQVAGTFQG